MTGAELARVMNVGRSTVSQWLSGRSYPPADKLIKVINLLDLADEFFPEKKQETEQFKKETSEVEKRLEKLETQVEEIAENRAKEKIQALEAQNAMLRAAIGDFKNTELIETMFLLREFGYDLLKDTAANLKT